jgi:hypothetical protein
MSGFMFLFLFTWLVRNLIHYNSASVKISSKNPIWKVETKIVYMLTPHLWFIVKGGDPLTTNFI